MSYVNIDLVATLGLSASASHSLSVVAKDSGGQYGDSAAAAMALKKVTINKSSTLNYSGATVWAVAGQAFSATFTPTGSYILPPKSTMSVLVNGTPLDATEFDFNEIGSGAFYITGSKVNGEVSISLRAAVNVQFSGLRMSSNGNNYALDNTDYTCTLAPDLGYMLPDKTMTTVKIGTYTLPLDVYSYSQGSGVITVPYTLLSSTLSITVNAATVVAFNGGTYLESDGDTSTVLGRTYNCKITVKDQYQSTIGLPSDVTVTMGGQTLVKGSDYTWNDTLVGDPGELRIVIPLTGTLNITAVGVTLSALYAPAISLSGSNLTITPNDQNGRADTLVINADGSVLATLYRFTVSNVDYYCIAGQTFREWSNHALSQGMFSCSGDSALVMWNGTPSNTYHVAKGTEDCVGGDVIEPGTAYLLANPS